MKGLFEKIFKKKKYKPIVNINRLLDAKFELNEMLVGVNMVNSRSSRQYWTERLSYRKNIDFLIVAAQLMEAEIERQKQEGIEPSQNIFYATRRQFPI